MHKNPSAFSNAHGAPQLAEILHEIRNPLAGVRAAIQVVSGRVHGQQERMILLEAVARLDHVEGLLSTLMPIARHADGSGNDDASRSGVHAIAVPEPAEKTNAER